MLANSQSVFPENPSVWVKDLAGYLNLKLTAPDDEPTLCSYAYGQQTRLINTNEHFSVYLAFFNDFSFPFYPRLSILPYRKRAEGSY